MLSDQTLVSIVLPIYNAQRYLEQCLDSLLAQDYPYFEIIAVDDGSTDNSRSILRDYERKHKEKMKAVITEHGGASHARNVGIREAKGQIVAIAEADAIYAPNWVSSSIKYFSDPKVGGVAPFGKPHAENFVGKCLAVEVEIRGKRYLNGSISPQHAWIIRKGVLDKLGSYDENLKTGEDRDLGYRILNAGFKIPFDSNLTWWHRQPNKLPDYLVKAASRSFNRGKNYYIKHPEQIPFLKTTLPFAIICASIILKSWKFFVIAVLVVLGIKAIKTAKDLDADTQSIPLVFGFSFIWLARSVVNTIFLTLGFINGFSSFILQKLKKKNRKTKAPTTYHT